MQATAAIVRDLSQLFRDKLYIEVPEPHTDLIDTGLLDSLQLVQLLVHVEQDLGYRIPLDAIDLDHLRSLERLARVIAAGRELEAA
jgi:acyl carrier protein